MFVVPKAGVLIRNPRTMQQLPAEGLEISFNEPDAETFWLRREQDGDVTILENAPVAPVIANNKADKEAK